MTPKALIPLLFEFAQKPVGRVVVGILLAGCALFVGVRGLATGEVWVPSSKPWTTDGLAFGRYSGASASLAYIFLGCVMHYVGFWKKGRLEDTRHDPLVLSFLLLCATAAIGFVILAIADV